MVAGAERGGFGGRGVKSPQAQVSPLLSLLVPADESLRVGEKCIFSPPLPLLPPSLPSFHLPTYLHADGRKEWSTPSLSITPPLPPNCMLHAITSPPLLSPPALLSPSSPLPFPAGKAYLRACGRPPPVPSPSPPYVSVRVAPPPKALISLPPFPPLPSPCPLPPPPLPPLPALPFPPHSCYVWETGVRCGKAGAHHHHLHQLGHRMAPLWHAAPPQTATFGRRGLVEESQWSGGEGSEGEGRAAGWWRAVM